MGLKKLIRKILLYTSLGITALTACDNERAPFPPLPNPWGSKRCEEVVVYYDKDSDTYGDTQEPLTLCKIINNYSGPDFFTQEEQVDCNLDKGILSCLIPEKEEGEDNDAGISTAPFLIYVTDNTDCDDNDSNIWKLHEDLYRDRDRDGRTLAVLVDYCGQDELPDIYKKEASEQTDCDDNDSTKWENKNVFADEDLDGVGAGRLLTKCLGNELEGYSFTGTDCAPSDPRAWSWVTGFLDGDEDGFTNPLGTKELCLGENSLPEDYLRAPSIEPDCNDGERGIHPGATEVCDGKDNDCNLATPDGEGDPEKPLSDNQEGVCANSYKSCAAGNWIESLAKAPNHEPVEMTCDGRDNDCDGETDEGLMNLYFRDRDGDGFGDSSRSLEACLPENGIFPLGFVLNNSDCDDSEPEIYRQVQAFRDEDRDMFTVGDLVGICVGQNLPFNYQMGRSQFDDCDDQNPEVWLNIAGFRDADLDGATIGNSLEVCSSDELILGYQLESSEREDCDDNNPEIHPEAAELCNGLDDDCEPGTTDGSDEQRGLNSLQRGVCLGSLQSCLNGRMGDDYSPVQSYESGLELSCEGLDNNCDGNIDEGLKLIFYRDRDGDGKGGLRESLLGCLGGDGAPPEGFVRDKSDCDDQNPTLYQIIEGLVDSDNDSFTVGEIREICSGEVLPQGYQLQASLNPDCNDADPSRFRIWQGFRDEDLDGRTVGEQMNICGGADIPSGYQLVSSPEFDCNDSNAGEWRIQQLFTDSDGDTYGIGGLFPLCIGNDIPPYHAVRGGDCDDRERDINPSRIDLCNGRDDDCNRETVDGSGDIIVHLSAEQRGVCRGSRQSCVGGEWQDTYNSIAEYEMGRESLCDSLDNDCDGETDEGLMNLYFRDGDRDGFGDLNNSRQACQAPVGYVNNSHDCNDNDRNINPNAQELCDRVDNNCSSQIDEGCGCVDGQTQRCGSTDVGQCEYGTQTCNINGHWSACQGNVEPQVEICDSLDNNCNGLTDEGLLLASYRDADGDSFGNGNDLVQACQVPIGYVNNNSDCNDRNPGLYQLLPGFLDNDRDGRTVGEQIFVCSGLLLPEGYQSQRSEENDCDDFNPEVWRLSDAWEDKDGDGWGGDLVHGLCRGNIPPEGYSAWGGDCEDEQREFYPGAAELCNLLDDDCEPRTVDGLDEQRGLNSLQQGVCRGSLQSCLNGRMRDDYSPVQSYESGLELSCDGLDNNCNREIDENFDKDNDGQTFCAGDQNDACQPTGDFLNINLTLTTDKTQYALGENVIILGDASVGRGEIRAAWVDLDQLIDSDGDGCAGNDIDEAGLEATIVAERAGKFILKGWAKDWVENYRMVNRTIMVKPHAEFDEVQSEAGELYEVNDVVRAMSLDNFTQHCFSYLNAEQREVINNLHEAVLSVGDEEISEIVYGQNEEGGFLVYKVDTPNGFYHGLGEHYYGKLRLEAGTAAAINNNLTALLSEEEALDLIIRLAPAGISLFYNDSYDFVGEEQAVSFDVTFDFPDGKQAFIEYNSGSDYHTDEEKAIVGRYNSRFRDRGIVVSLSADSLAEGSTYEISLAVAGILAYLEE